jgi:hypothetical protein
MLAGDASLGFGQASPVTHQGLSVGAYRRGWRAAVEPAAIGSWRIFGTSMIRKSGCRFSEKIMLKKQMTSRCGSINRAVISR